MEINTYFHILEKILLQHGSTLNIEYLKEKINYYKDSSYIHIVIDILQNMIQDNPLNDNIYGYLTMIHLKNDEFRIIEGKSCHNQEITENTMFDVASITKLFTLLLVLRLKETNILSLEETLGNEFPKIKDRTILDLIQMKDELRTPKRLEKLNKKDAEQVLKKTYLYEEKKYLYSDIPMIILSEIIQRKVNQKFQTNFTFDEIMDIFLLKPFHIDASFYPTFEVAGNSYGKECFDPKAKKMGPIGSAGLFISSKGLKDLVNHIDQIINQEDFSFLNTKIYEDVSRGNNGIYQKFPDFSKTYVPLEYSNESFASEGSTGSIFIYDPYLKIHNHILVDAIMKDTNQKHPSFQKNMNLYEQQLSKNTVLLYFLKQYYETFKSKDDIKIMIKK